MNEIKFSTNRTIFKYILGLIDIQNVELPVGAEILSVQTQNDLPCLWALVNPEWKKETVRIEIFGTGNPIPNIDNGSRKFISTFQMYNGRLVYHVFKRIDKK